MNKKVTLKDIAIMQSGIYMKTDSQGEVRYLQVKDVNSENKLDYTQIATVINTGINDKHWLKNGDLLFAAKGGSNLQSPNQKIPDRKTKCVIKTHINIKQNVIFGAKLKPV